MLHSRGLTAAKHGQPVLNALVGRIQLRRSLIGIKSIVRLVVARLVESSQVVPNLGNVRVEANSTGVGVQGIAVLVDAVVKNADGAPECRITAIAVHRLLICLICLGILFLRHVASPEEIPTLRISAVQANRLLQKLDTVILTGRVLALLVMQPTQLLENLRMVGICLQYLLIRFLGVDVLRT